jgi:2,3-dihydroxybenzoate decarboxylase
MSELKTGGGQGYLRIATEEAFAPPELMDLFSEVLDGDDVDPGFESLMGFYLRHKSERATDIFRRLQDLGEERLRDMDERGIDRQIIALTAPGTQILSRDKAVALSVLANDRLAEACARHPDRFTGMAACAPQDPAHAAREIERAVTKLGMRAVVINSHTHGEYLSDQKFWPILEAAEALDVPVYLHPQTPPRDMIKPFLEAGLDGAVFGARPPAWARVFMKSSRQSQKGIASPIWPRQIFSFGKRSKRPEVIIRTAWVPVSMP